MKLLNLLKTLDYERLAGTDGEQRAYQTIINHLKSINLKPHLETFEIDGFESGTAELICGSKSWEATPYGLCGDSSTTGELLYLENADALFLRPGAYDGKIILYNHSSKRLHELVSCSSIKALIGVSAPHKKAYSYSYRQNMPKEELIPSLMIRYDYAQALMKLSGQVITINIRQKAEKKVAHNIVLDIPGTGIDNSLTMLVGHYDTVARSHGASDNAAGTVSLIKAAEYFSKHKPARDLRIVWFSGEELGLLGSFAYANAHEDEIRQRLRLVVNVDLGGDPIGRNVLFVLGTKELMGYATGLLRGKGLLFAEQLNIYSSDGMPFSVFEIPSLNIARVGGTALFTGHTEEDTAKLCTEYGLTEIYLATQTLLDHVLNSQFYPINKEIDDSLRDKIERYLWNSTLTKPDLFWREKYKK
ncbi:MAG: hypothetical protein CVU49_03460 [Candidatus Cloacimonetes bacterium HGW-Cloacimonetes-2]|jgi:Iap family predicted aminopeptidase|nr:MAG: hypothetical protein CVU49_03460 [Candidatus Cloacimonetes bacterium HGW-Cloacimonetes-2]